MLRVEAIYKLTAFIFTFTSIDTSEALSKGVRDVKFRRVSNRYLTFVCESLTVLIIIIVT